MLLAVYLDLAESKKKSDSSFTVQIHWQQQCLSGGSNIQVLLEKCKYQVKVFSTIGNLTQKMKPASHYID